MATSPLTLAAPRPLVSSAVRRHLLYAAVGLLGGALFAIVAARTSPYVAAGVMVGGMLGLCMTLWPTAGLLLVAGTIPLERIGRLNEDFSSMTISLSRIVGLAALATFLVYALFRKVKLRFGGAFWLYAGYTFIAATTIVHAFEQKDAIRDTFRIIGNLCFFFYFVNVVRGIRTARLAVIAWLVASVGSVGYAAYDYHFGHSDRVEESQMGAMDKRFTAVVSDDSETRTLGVKIARAYGTTSHPTLFGLNLTMTLPFFACMIRIQPWRYKVLLFAGMAMIGYGIILSNTRAVMLLAVATMAAIVARGIWQLSARSIAALLLFGLCLTPLIPRDVYLRTLDPSLYSTQKSDSIRIRFTYWARSWDLIERYWPTGIGIGDQTTIVKMVTSEMAGRITPDGLKASAHNEYIWVMVEVGILGYLFHFGFIAAVLRAAFKGATMMRRRPEFEEQFWMLRAAQITLTGVLLFAVQTEAFHFPLKGWWLAAGLSWVMFESVRRQERLDRVQV